MHSILVLAIGIVGLQTTMALPTGGDNLIERLDSFPPVEKGEPVELHAPHEDRSPQAPPTYGLTPSYKYQVIHHHNVHRTNHSAPKIAWSDKLAATAAKIASGCVFQHVMDTDGGGYGQNIAAGANAAGISHIISDQFYNGEINAFGNQYGVANPTGFESWGHFSQVVWKNTKQVGCATQYCPNGVVNTGSNVPPYFTVCNYSPPGNYYGQYGADIGTPLGRATIRGHH